VISHLQEQGFHVRKTKRFLVRALLFSQNVKLSQHDLIPLEAVFFSEVGAHVIDKGACYGGRKIEGFANDHANSLTLWA
jgi:hypothetical protein